MEEARSAASDARSLYEATLDQSEEVINNTYRKKKPLNFSNVHYVKRANQCDRLQASAAELRSELFEVQQALANANSEERTLRDRLVSFLMFSLNLYCSNSLCQSIH